MPIGMANSTSVNWKELLKVKTVSASIPDDETDNSNIITKAVVQDTNSKYKFTNVLQIWEISVFDIYISKSNLSSVALDPIYIYNSLKT